MGKDYDNAKVAALLAGHISIDGSWGQSDFAALAVAAADQAGCSIREQMRIAAIVATTDGEVEATSHTSTGAR